VVQVAVVQVMPHLVPMALTAQTILVVVVVVAQVLPARVAGVVMGL
jgi:hypothetical protein